LINLFTISAVVSGNALFPTVLPDLDKGTPTRAWKVQPINQSHRIEIEQNE